MKTWTAIVAITIAFQGAWPSANLPQDGTTTNSIVCPPGPRVAETARMDQRLHDFFFDLQSGAANPRYAVSQPPSFQLTMFRQTLARLGPLHSIKFQSASVMCADTIHKAKIDSKFKVIVIYKVQLIGRKSSASLDVTTWEDRIFNFEP